jgi:hypothetical protein
VRKRQQSIFRQLKAVGLIPSLVVMAPDGTIKIQIAGTDVVIDPDRDNPWDTVLT